MPLISYSAVEARENMKGNHFHRWTLREKEKNDAKYLAVNRIHQGKLNIQISPPGFSLTGSESIFTIGSCFAREIEEALLGRNFKVITRHPAIQNSELLSPVDPKLRQTAFLNRYNTGSMLEEFKFILGEESSRVAQGKLFYESEDNSWQDLHYSPIFKTKTLADGLARRKLVGEQLSAIKQAEVIVITLGLIEAWRDTAEDAYLNVVPGPRVMRNYADRLRLDVLSFEDNIENLRKIYVLLKKHCRSDQKIIITVSPVPLEATFTRDDVVIANNRSKCILRAAAETFAYENTGVIYFPSFEMANFSAREEVWEWDGRHVKPSLVRYILNNFIQAYLNKNSSSV